MCKTNQQVYYFAAAYCHLRSENLFNMVNIFKQFKINVLKNTEEKSPVI